MVAGEQILLSLVEDVEIGGPIAVAVAGRPDVIALGDYFVKLVLSLALKQNKKITAILINCLVYGIGEVGGGGFNGQNLSTYHHYDPKFFCCMDVFRRHNYFLGQRFVLCILVNLDGDNVVPPRNRFWNGVRGRR